MTISAIRFAAGWAVVLALLLPAAGRVADSALPAEAGGIITSTGRFYSIVAIVIGVVSVGLGWRSMARPTPSKAVATLIVGLLGVFLSSYLLSISAGGVGTGKGRGGTILALVIGIIGTVLGAVSILRSNCGVAPVEDRPDTD